MIRRNSTYHVFLYETEVCSRTDLEYVTLAKRHGFSPAAIVKTPAVVRELKVKGYIEQESNQYKITEAGKSLLATLGKPLRLVRQRTPNATAAFKQATAQRLIAELPELPELSKDYLSYSTISLRPGSLDFYSKPSLHQV